MEVMAHYNVDIMAIDFQNIGRNTGMVLLGLKWAKDAEREI